MEYIISIEHVTKSYGRFHAVDDLSLHIRPGEIFGFLGPNGAGKSTTLRMLLSLIQPDTGHIRLFGLDQRLHRREILRRIGSIIEKPDFYLYLSGLDNLRIFGALSHTPRLRHRIDEILELTGLKGREGDRVQTYSHGMKQRLGLAQALLHDPELIILDEPTTGLDPQGIIELRNLILYLKQQGKTVLLSSHILSEIELIADSMAIMHRGKAVVQGRVADLLSAQENLLVHLETGQPETARALLRQSPFAHQLQGEKDNLVELRCHREEIPGLIALLSNQHIPLYSVQATRSLEDYFLSITEQARYSSGM